MRTSHLADDEKPATTLCGYPWEDWQDPTIPTDDEIGLERLPYAVRVEIRKADEARKPKPGERVQFCPACHKAAFKRAESVL